MSFNVFVKQLFTISLALIILALALAGFNASEALFWLYLLGILCFAVFSLFIFFYGYNTSRSDKLFSFNNVVIASFLIKLLMSIGFLMAFEKFFNPVGDSHIFHYLFLYIVYTVYEVHFLTKLAKVDIVQKG